MHETQHRIEMFSCWKCDSVFQNESLLSEHIKIHKNSVSVVHDSKEGLNDFECRICKISIHSEEWFVKHRTNHDKNMSYCQLCGEFFNSQSELQSHSKIHESLCKLVCEVCLKSFTRKYCLESHMLVHFPGEYYVCGVCKGSFRTTRNLDAHIKNVHNKNHKCYVCHKLFRAAWDLRTHMRTHDRGQTKQTSKKSTKLTNQSPRIINIKRKKRYSFFIKCKICKSSFFSEEWFNEHKSKHEQNMMFCSQGCQFFDSKLDFETHMVAHKSCDFRCYVCEKIFKAKATLENHMTIHFPTESHLCDVCNKVLRTKYLLKKHKYKAHQKKIECPICKKLFYAPSDMRRHSCFPKNIKKKIQCSGIVGNQAKNSVFWCVLCKIQVFSERLYNQHKSKHEKNYFYCPDGCQFFNSESDLKTHLATHKTSVDYVCDVCDKTFPLKSTLKHHLLSRHFASKSRGCRLCKKVAPRKTQVRDKENACSNLFCAPELRQKHITRHRAKDKAQERKHLGIVESDFSVEKEHGLKDFAEHEEKVFEACTPVMDIKQEAIEEDAIDGYDQVSGFNSISSNDNGSPLPQTPLCPGMMSQR